MKTIRQGKIPPPEKPWWVGKQLTCRKCGIVVELEEADEVQTNQERRPGGKREVKIPCPLCKSYMNHEETATISMS